MNRRVTLFIRKLGIRPGEGRVAFFAALYFFVLLGSYYLLRPLREEFGIRGGLEELPYLTLGTLACMVLLNPVFSWLVSKLPRTRFIPLVYRFFLLNLVVFFAVWRAFPDSQDTLGRVFFIWLSVFNLFAVSIFRQLMADCWSVEQAKRLYGIIGAGGTFGGVVGSFLMARIGVIEGWIGLQEGAIVPFLFLAAAAGLECCVQVFRALERAVAASPAQAVDTSQAEASRKLGGDAWEGMIETGKSPFLRRLGAYVFLAAVVGTLFYFLQAWLVSESGMTRTDRRELFGWMNFGQQSLTLLVQITATGAIMSKIGIGGALLVVPLISLTGVGVLLVVPVLAALFVVQFLRRGLRFALTRPAMESTYSLVPRMQKYKSKAFIDTALTRAGDVVGSGALILIAVLVESDDPAAHWKIGLPVMAIAGTLWLLSAFSLGRAAKRKDEKTETAPIS